ncbi:hypothetical protein [Paenisporosarcina sp. OV554]|uniref:hypothetical protein n=1 Tax=Paenisporosarcina sp. OV554 TaxID=2135694 RepID=UPI000D4658CF|nr:hypothetical protein C8K15_11674 [Paenisporosarcina sp. OV554]
MEILPNVNTGMADSWFVHLAIDPDTTVGPPEWFEKCVNPSWINAFFTFLVDITPELGSVVFINQ